MLRWLCLAFFFCSTVTGAQIANGVNRRTGMSDASGSTAWSYDSEGRITKQQRTINIAGLTPTPVSKTFTYTYNLDGSVATITYPSGRMLTYQYSAAGRQVSVADVANNVTYASAATYAPHGEIATVKLGVTATFAGITISNQYNNRLQPAVLSAAVPGQTIQSLSYNFNLGSVNNGNVAQIANNRDPNRTQTYTYDQLNRVSTAQMGSAYGNSYVYDPWNNLLQKVPTAGQAENLTIAVNSKNQIVGRSYDASGNLLNDGANVLAYDAENRATLANGVNYTYDGDGKRIAKSTGTLYWTGTSSDALVESDTAGNITAEYIFFNNKRIARRDPNGTVHYFLSDHLGSTNIVASATGVIEDESDFYPFGGERVVTDNLPNQQYKFTGKERDAESGLDYFGARLYSSILGRFRSPDQPLADQQPEDPQSWNLYAYARNNPLRFTDPTGNACVSTNGGKSFHDDDSGGESCADVDKAEKAEREKAEKEQNAHDVELNLYARQLFQQPVWSEAASFTNTFAVRPLMAFGYMFSAPTMIAAECLGGGSGCTGTGVALAVLPEVKVLREGAILLKEGAAAGKGAEILQKAGGAAQAAKDFEALPGAQQINGAVRVKTLADGTKAVLYESKSGSPTIALQAAGRTVTKVRY